MDEHFSQSGGYEKVDVNIAKTVVWTVVTIIATVVLLFVLTEYFALVKEEAFYEATLKPESELLIEVRMAEDSLLNGYKLLDSTSMVYRIPLERAMGLTAVPETED